MIQWFSKKLRNRKGFTLIELIVVIAILGILAAIAVPRLLGFQERAEEQADKQAAVQVRNALALLYANGEIVFSDGGADLVVTVPTTVDKVTGGENFTLTSAGVTTPDADIQNAIFDLTGAFDRVGTKAITVTLSNEGVTTVTSP